MSLCCKCLKELRGADHYGLHPSCFAAWYDCEPDEEIRDVTPREAESDLGSKRIQSFLHGKFKKFTARIGPHSHVLKVIQPDYPNLPGVEYVCNQIAERIGLDVPTFSFLRLDRQDCFVSRNLVEGTRWKKLTHIYHYLKKRDEFDVETLTDAVLRVTGRPQDVRRLHEILLFDALIGNNDRHGRNLGILSAGKISRLAPAYDNPSYIGVESLLGADLNPFGKIYTQQSQEPSMKDYVLELDRLGFKETVKAFRKQCSIEEILELIDESFLKVPVKTALKRLIGKRHAELIAHF